VDLKQYFRKMREIEASLTDEFPLVVSLDTPDGGKAGKLSEVSRQNAAKMIIEGRASLASEEAAKTYRARQAAAKEAADKAEMARRVQVAIISDPELSISGTGRKGNGPSTASK